MFWANKWMNEWMNLPAGAEEIEFGAFSFKIWHLVAPILKYTIILNEERLTGVWLATSWQIRHRPILTREKRHSRPCGFSIAGASAPITPALPTPLEQRWWLMRWYAQHDVCQEESEQKEVDGTKRRADSTRKVIHLFFMGEWEEFVFNAFADLEPVQRSEDGCDMRRFRSFNHSTCKTVLSLLEAV